MNQDAGSGNTASRQSPSHGYASTGSDSKSKSSGTSQKRASRAGTRSVTTLSAAQLERKRANDREAQRAIRQRTKDHIETLERRINELTVTNETREKIMGATQQRNRELEEENTYLRSRLGNETFAMNVADADAKDKPAEYSVTAPTSSPQHQLTGSSIPRPSSTSTSRSVPMAPLHTAQHPDSWRSHHGFNPSGGSAPSAFLAEPNQANSAPGSASWRAQDVGDAQTRIEQTNRGFAAGASGPERSPWMNSAPSYGYQVRPPPSQALSFTTSQPPAFQAVAAAHNEPTPVSAAFHTPGLVPQPDYPQMTSYNTSQQSTFHEQSQSHPAYQVNSAGDFHGASAHRSSLAPPSYNPTTTSPQFMPAQTNHGQGLAYRPEATTHTQYGYDG